MKILIIIEFFYPHLGGVEHFVYETGKLLTDYGHQITIFTTQEINDSQKPQKTGFFGILKTCNLNGMTIIRIRTPGIFKRYLFPLFSFPFLLFYASKNDLVHSANNYTVALPAFIAAKIFNKPATISVWEIWGRLWFRFYFWPFAMLYLLYENLILTLPFTQFIAPSRFVSNQLKKNNKSVIPLGFRDIKIRKYGAEKLRKKLRLGKYFVFLYSGRFGKSKGVQYLIPAFAKHSLHYPDSRLLINITNLSQSLKTDLLKIFTANNIKNKIILLGGVDKAEFPSLLSLADCVVTPDLTISFGLLTLEASRLKIPLVTSNAGGLKEVAYGKVIFVKPADKVDLTRGLNLARENKFRIISDKFFSWEKCAKDYEKLFLSAIKSTLSSKSKNL